MWTHQIILLIKMCQPYSITFEWLLRKFSDSVSQVAMLRLWIWSAKWKLFIGQNKLCTNTMINACWNNLWVRHKKLKFSYQELSWQPWHGWILNGVLTYGLFRLGQSTLTHIVLEKPCEIKYEGLVCTTYLCPCPSVTKRRCWLNSIWLNQP